MGQSDILDLLSKSSSSKWFSVRSIAPFLNISKSCLNRNVKSLYKYRDFYGLEFKIGRYNAFLFRKKK